VFCSKNLLHFPFPHVYRFGSSEATFVHVGSLLKRKQITTFGILYTLPILVTRIPLQCTEQFRPTAEQGRLGSLLQVVLAPFGYSATLHVFAVTLQS
jgi:hypothetical protein